jgi:hypothetical protein
LDSFGNIFVTDHSAYVFHGTYSGSSNVNWDSGLQLCIYPRPVTTDKQGNVFAAIDSGTGTGAYLWRLTLE